MEIDSVRSMVGESKTLQGNLDPCVLYADHKFIEKQTKKLLDSFKSKRHIVNLGHGIYPDTDFSKVKTFINTVKNYENKNFY
jgi:uroporphyrinogen decarboxylase